MSCTRPPCPHPRSVPPQLEGVTAAAEGAAAEGQLPGLLPCAGMPSSAGSTPGTVSLSGVPALLGHDVTLQCGTGRPHHRHQTLCGALRAVAVLPHVPMAVWEGGHLVTCSHHAEDSPGHVTQTSMGPGTSQEQRRHFLIHSIRSSSLSLPRQLSSHLESLAAIICLLH